MDQVSYCLHPRVGDVVDLGKDKRMKVVTSEAQEPIIKGIFEPDHYERGLDPWHADAMPDEFKGNFPSGERKAGWFGVDWCGNTVIWVPDGTEMEVSE